MSKKIIFFGNERLATGVTTNNPVMNRLIEEGYEIDCLILNQESYNSRKLRTIEAEELAIKNNIKVFKPASIQEVKEIILKSGTKLAVLVAYGKLIPESVIDMFPLGIINIHPSLLPDKRGSTPIEQTILDGDKLSGVSLMKLTKGMDSGPIYDQIKIELSGKESKQELSEIMNIAGAEILIKNLPDIMNGGIKTSEQANEGVTITKQISKNDGVIDWNQSSDMIERKSRAYKDWPKLKTTIFDQKVVVEDVAIREPTKLKAGDIICDKDSLIIASSDKGIEILALRPENKNSMAAKAFIAGYKK